MRIRIMLVCALTACLFCSCRKPADGFEFRFTPAHPSDTFVFRYEMLLDEPQASYSTYIACRCKASAIDDKCVPLLISVTSPGGERALERIDFPLTRECRGVEVKHIGSSMIDIVWPYRSRIVPGRDTGVWQIAIRPVGKEMAKNIYGIGVSYEKQ